MWILYPVGLPVPGLLLFKAEPRAHVGSYNSKNKLILSQTDKGFGGCNSGGSNYLLPTVRIKVLQGRGYQRYYKQPSFVPTVTTNRPWIAL